MGRRDTMRPGNETEPLRLQRVPFIDGCYDRGGAYWGGPANLWCSWGADCEGEQVHCFVRANSRAEAKAAIVTKFPDAKFIR